MADEQCSICLGPFSEPKGLPCLHTFCRECLQMYIDNQKNRNNTPSNLPYFNCPMCRGQTKPSDPSIPRREWAKSFPTNNYVLNQNRGQKMCPLHPDKALDISCKTCKVIICLRCCLSTHEKCEKILTQATAKMIKNNLSTHLEDIKVKMEPLVNRVDTLEQEKQTTVQHVKQMTEELLGFIEKQRERWLQEVEAAHLRKSGALQEQKEKFAKITGMVEENINEINSLIGKEDAVNGHQKTYDYHPKHTPMAMKIETVSLTDAKSEYQISQNFVKIKDKLLKEDILIESGQLESSSETAMDGIESGAGAGAVVASVSDASASEVYAGASFSAENNASAARASFDASSYFSEAAAAETTNTQAAPIPHPFQFITAVSLGRDILTGINDMVILPDQCFLISEACFKKIWKFSAFGERMQTITLDTEPYGLCILQDQRVAISLPYSEKISILTFSNLKEIDRVEFQKKYYGLASDKGERIFALYRDQSMCVDIISKNNPRNSYEVCHVVNIPSSFYFCDDYRIRALPSGNILTITPTSIMSVICIDQNGKQVFTYSGVPSSSLSSVGDVVVGWDFIYIADKTGNKIHRLGHQGDFIDTPLTSNDNIKDPRKIFISDAGILAVLSKSKKETQVQLFSI